MRQCAAVGPGSSCDPASSVCTGGSACIGGSCKCSSGLILVGGKCEAKRPVAVGPGEGCGRGQQCGRGSVCSSVTKRCMCPIGMTLSGSDCVDRELVPQERAGVGQPCSLNTDCISGAYCNANRVKKEPSCDCLSTHVHIGSVCYRSFLLPPSLVTSLCGRVTGFPVKYPGQANCDYDAQCEAAYAGAKCRNSVCVCPPRMAAVGGTCRHG